LPAISTTILLLVYSTAAVSTYKLINI
jgi:hypothetical protein